MSKKEFLAQLRQGLSGLPQEEAAARLLFYSEMIDDRMEEGLSEAEAVSEIGSVNEIVAQIAADVPLTMLVKERIKPKKRLSGWEILLLLLGFPLWFPLLAAAFAVVLSLYISFWAVIISLWSVFASLICCSLAGIIAGVGFIFAGNGLTGGAMISIGIFCAGLSIFAFFGCKVVTKGTAALTKQFGLWSRNCFMRREERE